MKSLTRRAALAVIAIAGLCAPSFADWRTTNVGHCPFCSPGQTLTADAAQANMILFGKLSNAQLDPNDPNSGTTDLEIESVVKAHEVLPANQKVLTLKRYLPLDKDSKFLVFCDVYKGQIDPYRGEAVPPDSKIAEYLKGALKIKEQDAVARLNFFFSYLDNKDIIVSNDAFTEFGNADYKEFRQVAEKASPAKVAAWLKDPTTPPSRLGLYGAILGHCGKAEDAKLLREIIDDPQHQIASGIDGILAGLVQLQPKEGWAYVKSIIRDPQRDFLLRYATLRAARFFHDFRTDVIPLSEIAPAIAAYLDQKDIADLAIEDLRKWSRWEVADKVIGMYGKEEFGAPIIRRAVLRFALCVPPAKYPKAAEFVAQRRKEDPKYVEEVEELLRLENTAPIPPAGPGGGLTW